MKKTALRNPIKLLALTVSFTLSAAGSRVYKAVDSHDLDLLFILPQIFGDVKKLDSLIKQLNARVEAVSKFVPAPRIGVVQIGDLGSFKNVGSNDAIQRFQSLMQKKYQLYGVYGDYEMEILHGFSRSGAIDSQLLDFIRKTYSIFVTVEAVWPKPSIIGPEGGNMLLVNPVIASASKSLLVKQYTGSLKISADNMISVQSTSDYEACQLGLSALFPKVGMGRLITAAADFSNRCGSRLVTLGSSSWSFLEVTFEPLLRISLLGNDQRTIWPILSKPKPIKAEEAWKNYDNVVVIPDIHGDYDAFVDSLWLAYNTTITPINHKKFIEQVKQKKKFPKTSKRVLVVQLGDLIDREIESIFGWKVIHHYGNHEIMTFHQRSGDYVHKQDDLPPEDRKIQFSLDGKTWKKIAQSFVVASAIRGDPGQQSSWLFVHGGLTSRWFRKFGSMIDSVRSRESSRIESLNEFASHSFTSAAGLSLVFERDDSPVWSRMYEKWPESRLCQEYLPGILSAFKVDRIMVGHMPQDSGKPRLRCGGRIVLADVKISRWMNVNGIPNPSAYLLTSDGSLRLLQLGQAIDT